MDAPFEPFFMHPNATVIILDGNKLNDVAIKAALVGVGVWSSYVIWKRDIKPLVQQRMARKEQARIERVLAKKAAKKAKQKATAR